MISVAEAAHAYLLDAVALAESDGSRVRWPPWGPQPSGDAEGDHIHSYFMVVDDGRRGFEFALRYRGRPNDLVPEGFWDFTLFLEGGKGHLSDLLSPVPPSERAAEPERTEDGRPLRLVRWLVAQPGETLDPSATGGTLLRCLYDEILVAVDDPDQRCPCGRLGRDDDGRLLPLTEGQICVVHSTAAGGAPEPAGARRSV